MTPSNKIIIVSPSGQFYGSEQVLLDFLQRTSLKYSVYAPKNSIFYEHLKVLPQHKILNFGSLKILYFKLFWLMLTFRCNTLYVNEGGHIKYIKLLARFFKRSNFIVHIRIVEDCSSKRLGKLPPNITLVSISTFISSCLEPYSSQLIYDPMKVNPRMKRKLLQSERYDIGIIGRVSKSKGLQFYREFFEYIKKNPLKKTFTFHFYGDIITHEQEVNKFLNYCGNSGLNIVFEGFEPDQEQMYSCIDLVLHLNHREPLGRIALESWAQGIPVLGFDEGGIGEINNILDVKDYLITKNEDWPKLLAEKLNNLDTTNTDPLLRKARRGVEMYFGVQRYVDQLEGLILNSVK